MSKTAIDSVISNHCPCISEICLAQNLLSLLKKIMFDQREYVFLILSH